MTFIRTVTDLWWSDVTGDDCMPIGPVYYLKPGDDRDGHVGPGHWQRKLLVELDHDGVHAEAECWLIRAKIRADVQERSFEALEARVAAQIKLPI